MRKVDLSEPVLRGLVDRHPFYEIARMYKCDVRTVGHLAARYGLASAFVSKAATAEEEARIRELSAEGLSIKRIAGILGRSQEFVAKRVRGAVSDQGTSLYPGRKAKTGWPRPDTTPEAALGGRRYGDVSEEILVRECSPYRFPVSGWALASVAQTANRSYSRSAADLCTEA